MFLTVKVRALAPMAAARATKVVERCIVTVELAEVYLERCDLKGR